MSEEKKKQKEEKVPIVMEGRLINHHAAEDTEVACNADELAEFIEADEKPTRASQEFKHTLWEKLWRMVKDKYHLLILASALLLR